MSGFWLRHLSFGHVFLTVLLILALLLLNGPVMGAPPEEDEGRPWLGVRISSVTSELAAELRLEEVKGVVITEVFPGGPAAQGGIMVNDIVLALEDEEIGDARHLARSVASAGVGTEITLLIYRDGSSRTIRATLSTRPAEQTAGEARPPSSPANSAIDMEPDSSADQLYRQSGEDADARTASLDLHAQQVSPPTLWTHNGSTMKLIAEGAGRRFYYVEPRQGMREQGVTPGTLLFDGQRIGDRYSGIAYVFSNRCGSSAYEVSGDVAPDQRSVALYGQAPRRDAECRIVGHRDDRLLFEYVQSAPTAASPQASELTDSAHALHLQEPLTYSIPESVSDGVLNMRGGPGIDHPVIVGIPAGATGVRKGTCRPPDDGQSLHDWCEVEWRGFTGWASSCCIIPD